MLQHRHRRTAAGVCVLLVFAFVYKASQPGIRGRLQLGPRSYAGCGLSAELRNAYLHVVKASVTGVLLHTPGFKPGQGDVDDLTRHPFDMATRQSGRDWPEFGMSMAGMHRMNNIEELWKQIFADGTAGDFIEAGTWRGGASIVSRAVLKAYGVTDRQVHVVDSFEGLPTATTAKDGDKWSKMKYLAVSQEQVAAHFERYQLLDEQVHFYKGYFRYSLPTFRAGFKGKLAMLRLDGDMFESTYDELFNLYDKLSVGGFVIVDDWSIKVCQAAVREFFKIHEQEMPEPHPIDRSAVWLQKLRDFPVDHTWYSTWNESRDQEQ